MQSSLGSRCLILMLGGILLQADGRLRAEEPKEEFYRLKAIQKDGKEKTYDLGIESDAKELAEKVSKGEIQHLEVDEQPNILALRWDLGLWTIVVFLLLFFVLKKLAWKPMLEGLQKREDNIRSAVEDAQQARDEAQRLRDQLQREVDHAHEKVRDILDEGRKRAQEATEQMIAKARTEIQAERDRLRREIEMARDQALQELWKQTADLATMVSAKAIRRQLTEEDHRRLVDEALAELQGAGKAGRG